MRAHLRTDIRQDVEWTDVPSADDRTERPPTARMLQRASCARRRTRPGGAVETH
jgi:hypothetical protein